MNEGIIWLIRGLLLLLGGCYPAVSPKREQVREWGRDPSYAIYQDYRYTYDTYVYLFWDENTGAGPEDGGTMALGGGWNQPESLSGKRNEVSEGEPASEAQTLAQSDAEAGEGRKNEENTRQGEMPAMAQLQDYDYLMKNFYSVHSSTTAPRDLMKAEELVGTDLTLEKENTLPQILIYHTHSQETYADYGPDHPDASVVTIGNELTRLLEERGWRVIHDTSAYDIQGGTLDRSRAYNYALEGISRILQENPSIQVVLDLHRDGVKDTLHLVSEVNGKPTANIMFFQGMSRTPEGEIEYLYNPYLKENLAFTLQMQLEAARSFPGYTRKIYMKGLRYNLHLRPRSALIEVGAQTNSTQEALNAMEPLTELLDRVLQGR